MEGPGPKKVTWDDAMQQALAWLRKMEKDSQLKWPNSAVEPVRADAEAAQAWIAFATELSNHSRRGPSDAPGSR